MIADLIAKLTRVKAAADDLRPLLAELPADIRAEVLADLAGEGVPPGKPAAPPIRSDPPAVRGRKPGQAVLTVVKALAGGPLRVSEVATRIDAAETATSAMLRHWADRLFRKVDPDNRFSPWELTAEGRRLLSDASGPPPTPSPDGRSSTTPSSDHS